MSQWIYFMHPRRENFAETMTPEEDAVYDAHSERLKRMLEEGTLIMAGPTLGHVNTGLVIFEAPDEPTARRIMEEDPTIARGIVDGELRPIRVSLLRSRP